MYVDANRRARCAGQLLLGVIAALTVAGPAQAAAPGSLDASFGNGGVVTTPIGASSASAVGKSCAAGRQETRDAADGEDLAGTGAFPSASSGRRGANTSHDTLATRDIEVVTFSPFGVW